MSEIPSVSHYLYLDETGTLDFETREGEAYFGVGTACYSGKHGEVLWSGLELRTMLEERGVHLPKGFHAKNYSHPTRAAVYELIAQQNVRFEATMLNKGIANENVKAGGKIRLYQTALWLHLKYVVPEVSSPGNQIFVIAGHLQTTGKREAIKRAVEDVCQQLARDRIVVPCIWDAASSWGIQAVDYALWSVQREVEGKLVPDYCGLISSKIKTVARPWS